MTAPTDPVELVRSRLGGVQQRGPGQFRAFCPAHEDRQRSLELGTGDDGRALLWCGAGCGTDAILEPLSLTTRDLMPAKQNGNGRSTIVATYGYHDEAGELLYQVVRFKPKDFRQRKPDGNGGWQWKLGDTRRVLYRLREVLDAAADSFVFVVEGEQDADRLAGEGLVATTCPQGAGKWSKVDDTPLDGRHVVMAPDNDEQGQQHADDVAAKLKGRAASVRVLKLPDLPAKGDVSDWLDSGGDVETLVQLAENTPTRGEAAPAPDAGDVPVVATKHDRGDGDGEANPPAKPGPRLTKLADVQPETIKWLWPQRIALGKLTLVAGKPGLGKSFLTLDLASRVSNGKGFPDDPRQQYDPGGVVLLSAEDALGDTIRPRLDAAGADVSRIVAMSSVAELDDQGNQSERMPDLTRDTRHVEEAIQQTPDCRLVIIDPISAYCGDTDSHKNAEVRAMLAPLSELASKYGVAVVAVSHLRKGEGSAVDRIMGSLAFVAAARAVWAVTEDENNRDRRLFLPVKNNIGSDRTGMAYTLDGTGRQAPAVTWEADPVDMTADDAIGERKPGPEPTARDQAEQWLRQALANGPRPKAELEDHAEADGHTKGTLRRAKQQLNITAYRPENPGPWYWRLETEGAGAQ